MADRVTFDFETCEIIFDTDDQKGIEYWPGLPGRKTAITAAAGYEAVDFPQYLREIGLGSLVGDR